MPLLNAFLWSSFHVHLRINNRKLAAQTSIKTSPTVYLDISVYDKAGDSIKMQFTNRLRAFQRKGGLTTKPGPHYRMLKAAYQYWNEINNLYDGSENVMKLMEKFGYVERDELDAFIRWILIDYEMTFSNVALLNYNGPSEGLLGSTDSDSLVVDQRGFETILTKFMSDYNIPDPMYEVKVRYSSRFYYDHDLDLSC